MSFVSRLNFLMRYLSQVESDDAIDCTRFLIWEKNIYSVKCNFYWETCQGVSWLDVSFPFLSVFHTTARLGLRTNIQNRFIWKKTKNLKVSSVTKLQCFDSNTIQYALEKLWFGGVLTEASYSVLCLFRPWLIKIIKYLRQYAHSHWSIGVFTWEYANTVVTSRFLCFPGTIWNHFKVGSLSPK